MTSAATPDWPRRVAILGVGLLGGSVALALRRARPQVTLVGLARSQDKARQLEQSQIVNATADSIEASVNDCDVVVVASPVDRIAPMAIEAANHCGADCLITDVGSTKGRIVDEVMRDPRAAGKFVAAHPIAGSEKSGARHASADLLDGKVVVITPVDQTDENLLEKADHFWRLCGAVTTRMSPAEHDAHLAAVSHVPHLVSALVARMTIPEARSLVGSGWQDITRVAAGDPTLWTAICRENSAAIRRELGKFSAELNRLCRIIDQEEDEALLSWLAEAKRMKEETQ